MTSRERVLAAVNHKQPDRVPIGLLFSPEAQAKAMAHLGIHEDRAFWEWTGNDSAVVAPDFPGEASPIRYADPTIEVTTDGRYLDIYRVPFRRVQTGFQEYVDIAGEPPLREAVTPDDLKAFPWPTADIWDYASIPAALERVSEKATECQSRGFFEISHFMRGMEAFLTDMALDPPMACAIMDSIIEHLFERARRILETAAGGYAVFEYNDDVASQRGLMVSPELWRRYLKPRMAVFCSLYKRHGAKVRYHCCGSVRAIIPDLIEIGVDILNPIQPLAAGMDPFELKREFGRDLTFHGGVDIQDFLIHASPQAVRDHTLRMIDVIGADGGFILAGSHSIQADTPPENVVAMVETAKASIG
ncbi:hypothetical protein HQ560_14145 [bacterium]|nr:hypothetical protein [bacterium]